MQAQANRWRPEKVTISEKLSHVTDHWNPRIIAELNGQQVKIAKLLGEFEWHTHRDEDELFWVLAGRLELHIEHPSPNPETVYETIVLNPGELFVVPRGVRHKPVAATETEILLFEPASTINTGDQTNHHTRTNLERL